jgi:hypothetical protein
MNWDVLPGWRWMREAFSSVANCIHGSVFVRDERQTLRNRSALGITTAEARPAQFDWRLQVGRRGAGMFRETILNV